MDKVSQIVTLISEKSRVLQDELDSLSPLNTDDSVRNELISQVAILDELYNEVKQIQAQDD
jgi:hypothetical protein